MTNSKQLVPKPKQFIGDVLDRARREVVALEDDSLEEENYHAMIYYKAFGLIEKDREKFSEMARDGQSKLIAAMTKEQAWLSMPRKDDKELIGYADLNQMLLTVPGLSQTARYNFVGLSEILLPYMEVNGIDEEQYLDVYRLLVEAIGPIRQHAEQYQVKNADGTKEWVAKKDRGDRPIVAGARRVDPDGEYLEEVQLILADVIKPEATAESIRAKHQKHYKPALGRGGWIRLEDQQVLTVVCSSEDDVKEVIARLPRIEWDMMVTGFRSGSAIKMLIEDEL